MSDLSKRFIPLIPMLFVFLWSTGFIGAKFALPFIEPFYLLLIRMLLTIAVFVALAMLFKSAWPNPRQAGHQLVVGFLVHGAYLGGVFAAIKWGMPAGVTAIVVGIQPLITALLSWRCFNESLKAHQWSGLMLGLLGVITVLLTTQQYGAFEFYTPAIIAVLLSLFGISIGTLYQKRFGQGVNLVTGSVWQYVSTAVLMAILTWKFESAEVIWHPQLIWALAWLVRSGRAHV